MRDWLDHGNAHNVDVSQKVLDVVKHLLWVNDPGKKKLRTFVQVDAKRQTVEVRCRLEHPHIAAEMFRDCTAEKSFESIDRVHVTAHAIALRMLDDVLEQMAAMNRDHYGV